MANVTAPKPAAPATAKPADPPSLAGLLFSPEVEVTVSTRMVDVTSEHREAAAAAITLYGKDKSAWLKVGPIPQTVTMPDGSTQTLDQKAVDSLFGEFLTAVKVAAAEAGGYSIRKGQSQNPRVLRYHVSGKIENKNGSTSASA